MTVLQTARYSEILEKRGAQGALCGMDSQFVTKVFEQIHEESVRQQIEIINKWRTASFVEIKKLKN